MLLTEEEAHKRLCPERCYGQLDVMCIASQCMAWRVHDRVKRIGPSKVEMVVIERGYCGLAGPVKRRMWRK